MNSSHWLLIDCETEVKPTNFPLSIAFVQMQEWEPLAEPAQIFLNWEKEISAEATAIHGLTRDYLRQNGREGIEALNYFREVVGELSVGSYNFRFDGDTCLNPELGAFGLKPISRALCLLNAARRLFDPNPAENHKLQTLRTHFKAPERKAHGALDDVLTVLDLLPHFRARASAIGVNTWAEFVTFANAEWYPPIITFGKFKGQSVQSLKGNARFLSYCQWLEANADGEDFRKMARYYRSMTQ